MQKAHQPVTRQRSSAFTHGGDLHTFRASVSTGRKGTEVMWWFVRPAGLRLIYWGLHRTSLSGFILRSQNEKISSLSNKKKPKTKQLWQLHSDFQLPVFASIPTNNRARRILARCSCLSVLESSISAAVISKLPHKEAHDIIPLLFVRPKWVRPALEWCSSVSFTSVWGSVVTPWPAVPLLSITLPAQGDWVRL